VRILSIASSLSHGGAETVLVDLVLGLSGHEHRVVHSTATRGAAPHGPFLRRLTRAGVRCDDISFDALATPRGRHEILGEFQPDVVLLHWWGRDCVRRWVDGDGDPACTRRPSFVCVLHHAGIPAPSGYDHYVVVTRTQMGQVPSVSDRRRVHLIHNGVDLARFRASARRRRATRRMVVGRLSRLSHDKIPVDWLQTAAAYALPQTRFIVAGDGPLLATLREDVVRLGLADRFTLPGYIARGRVPALLERFDVFCHVTSTAVECQPLALLEALAAGVPIVAEDRGGIPEIVTHGVDGLLASTAEEIGGHLHALRRDGALRRRLSTGARRTARRFSLRNQLNAYRRLLVDIDRERRAGGT
jgi:glycosyltransferase involved in cell wall biosynthesis